VSQPTPLQGEATAQLSRDPADSTDSHWVGIQAHRLNEAGLWRNIDGTVKKGMFTKRKSDSQLDYVPTPTWAGNQIYLLSMLLAHNFGCAGDRPSSLAHNA